MQLSLYHRSMVERWYASKVDWWLGILVVLAPVVAVGGALAALSSGAPSTVAVAGVVIIAIVYLGAVFPMRYGIDDDVLVVRYGLIRQRVPLADITRVERTRNPLSSPALSLDRLMIHYGRRRIMISPGEREDFLAELARRARLQRNGETLSRG